MGQVIHIANILWVIKLVNSDELGCPPCYFNEDWSDLGALDHDNGGFVQSEKDATHYEDRAEAVEVAKDAVKVFSEGIKLSVLPFRGTRDS